MVIYILCILIPVQSLLLSERTGVITLGDRSLSNFFSSKRFLLKPTLYRRVLLLCVETKRDIENAVEGGKTCLPGRHCSAVLLISKFRAQHALIRGDFEPLHKILPLHFLFLCSPSYPGQTLAGCDFKYGGC